MVRHVGSAPTYRLRKRPTTEARLREKSLSRFRVFALSCFRGQLFTVPSVGPDRWFQMTVQHHVSLPYFSPQPRKRPTVRTAHVLSGIVATHLRHEIHLAEHGGQREA